LQFFEDHRDGATFALVNFGDNTPSMRDLTLAELLSEYDLAPVKYKLARRR